MALERNEAVAVETETPHKKISQIGVDHVQGVTGNLALKTANVDVKAANSSGRTESADETLKSYRFKQQVEQDLSAGMSEFEWDLTQADITPELIDEIIAHRDHLQTKGATLELIVDNANDMETLRRAQVIHNNVTVVTREHLPEALQSDDETVVTKAETPVDAKDKAGAEKVLAS